MGLLLWLVASFSHSLNATEPDLEAWFFHTYPEAAAKIEAALNGVQLESTYECRFPKGDMTEQRVYYFDRGRWRCDSTVHYQWQPDQPEREVKVKTPTISFFLKDSDPNAPGKLSVVNLSAGQRDESTQRLFGPAIFAPTSFYDVAIIDFMREDSFRITGIRKEQHDGQELLVIDWNSPVENRYRTGTFVFDTDSWVCLRHQMSIASAAPQNNGTVFTTERTMYYDGKIAGIPRLTKWEQHGIGDGTRHFHQREEIQTFRQTKTPAEEFSLAAFGLNARTLPSRHPPLWQILGLLLLAVLILLLLVWGVWRLLRHRGMAVAH